MITHKPLCRRQRAIDLANQNQRDELSVKKICQKVLDTIAIDTLYKAIRARVARLLGAINVDEHDT